jgi:hypothetical protein
LGERTSEGGEMMIADMFFSLVVLVIFLGFSRAEKEIWLNRLERDLADYFAKKRKFTE